MGTNGNSVWCVAYINAELINKVDGMIARSNLPLKAQIPAVKVITKRFKGRVYFSDIPLLFNYGFFRLPLEYAHSLDKLDLIKSRIPVIFSWMYTHSENLKGDDGHYLPKMQVETVKFREIVRLKRVAMVESIYSARDIDNLQEGSYLVLKGYPFDNMPAEVLSINRNKEEVKVRLLFESFAKEVTVSFANIFYTIYADCDDPHTKDKNSIESLIERSRFKIDKLQADDYFENE